MSNEWFCKIMGDEWGPLSTEELRVIARRGPLTRNDLVRRSESGSWVRGELVNGLFDDAVSAAASGKNVALSESRALPAKRSVRRSFARKYWVYVGDHTAGPFTDAQTAATGGRRQTKAPLPHQRKSHPLGSSFARRRIDVWQRPAPLLAGRIDHEVEPGQRVFAHIGG